MKHQEVIFSNDIDFALNSILKERKYNKIFLLTDTNVDQLVLPKFPSIKYFSDAIKIVIKSGDINKDVTALSNVWKQLGELGATRHSLIINLGGGVVSDLGGFAAATFKRGIDFINIPTTLLSSVDAAVGGKTGINFNGLKNEIGVFKEAIAVIISTCFFSSLPLEEIKSGYAEMIKHGLLSNKESYDKLLKYNFSSYDSSELLELLKESVEVKRKIVIEDPYEKGLRRALNLGHTAGHAFESYAMKRSQPIPHGYAVAWGLVVELILSNMKLNFDSKLLHQTASYIYDNYGAFPITCDDYDALITIMHHDKKSDHGELNFTLLKDIGDIEINSEVSEEEVKSALDIYRDLFHL